MSRIDKTCTGLDDVDYIGKGGLIDPRVRCVNEDGVTLINSPVKSSDYKAETHYKSSRPFKRDNTLDIYLKKPDTNKENPYKNKPYRIMNSDIETYGNGNEFPSKPPTNDVIYIYPYLKKMCVTKKNQKRKKQHKRKNHK